MIMIVQTPGSQMGSPAAAERGGEVMGGGREEQKGRENWFQNRHVMNVSRSS